MRPEVFSHRLRRRARLRDAVNEAMPDIDKAVAKFNLNQYYDQALNLIVSGRARNAFDLKQEKAKTKELYATIPSAKAAAGPALGGSRHPRGGSRLAQGGQQQQPLLGRVIRLAQAYEGSVRAHARQGVVRPLHRS